MTRAERIVFSSRVMKRMIASLLLVVFVCAPWFTAQAQDEFTFTEEEAAQNLEDVEALNNGAQTTLDGLTVAGIQPGFAQSNNQGLTGLIGQVLRVLLSLTGIIFLLMLIWGGVLYLVDAGNEKNVAKAKQLLTASIIGLLIVVSAYAISQFVFDQLAAVVG